MENRHQELALDARLIHQVATASTSTQLNIVHRLTWTVNSALQMDSSNLQWPNAEKTEPQVRRFL